MSSLLEEAIVDAKALKEAALKNAENAVLEKYSAEVKGALDTLLEQDEMGLGLEESEEDGADATFTEDVPYAFQSEELDAPAENDLVEIDLFALKTRIEEEAAEGIEPQPDDMIDPVDMADDMFPDAEAPEPVAAEPETAAPATPEALQEDADEEIALTEEMLSDLVEELVVDMTPRPQGWASVASANNSVEQANNDAMAAAQAVHLEEDEELEEDVDTAPDVVSDSTLNENENSELTESIKELEALLIESKTQLMKLNLDNAKLVYQNKALSSTSLNERQKNQIVEAVQSANSVEEASMIFETIQNAVGATPDQRTRPQTLREAVTRPTSLLINSNKKNNKATKDPNMGRMLRLAGLNKQ